MSAAAQVKPTHKAIQQYHATLQGYKSRHVEHEGALERGFQRLLADTARIKSWNLVPKLKFQAGKKLLFPDGTLIDDYNLKRGFWEAKDTHDDLEQEIGKKIAKGYPLSNTIFEDTRQAVLFQNGKERLRIELARAQQLADPLNEFYGYTEPEHEDFEKAIADFKERVPELARGLDAKIKTAHKDNAKFQAAFADFLALCQATLDPKLSRAAVDEMLVQHLLTEPLPENNSPCPGCPLGHETAPPTTKWPGCNRGSLNCSLPTPAKRCDPRKRQSRRFWRELSRHAFSGFGAISVC